MHFLIALLVCTVCVFFMTSCAAGAENKGGDPGKTTTIKVSKIKGLDKKDIRARLKKLSRKRKIKPKMGAMCYDTAIAPTVSDYICPDCGEKTVYESERRMGWVLSVHLEACRREIKELEKLVDGNIKLVEKQFCRKCTPEEIKTPRLNLVVSYSTGEKRMVKGISHNDLVILREFFEGKRVHKGGNDSELPLQDSIKRIEDILGVKLDAGDEKK